MRNFLLVFTVLIAFGCKPNSTKSEGTSNPVVDSLLSVKFNEETIKENLELLANERFVNREDASNLGYWFGYMQASGMNINDSLTIGECLKLSKEYIKNRPDVEILNHSITSEEYTGAITIHVQIRNNTNKLISYIGLKGVFYGADKQIVGTGIGNAVNIAADATKTIDILSIGIEGATQYEIEIENVIYQ